MTTDHAEQLVRLLPSQFQDKPQLAGLLADIAPAAQELETAFAALVLERTIDAAVGAQLDVIGRIVGQDREGLSDELYRRYIRARIRATRSNGTRADLGDITRLVMTGLGVTVDILEGGMEAVVRVLNVPITSEVAAATIRFLRVAKPAAVRVLLHTTTVELPETFTLGGGPGQGFAEGSRASLTSAGAWSFTFSAEWIAPGARYNGYTLTLVAETVQEFVVDHVAKTMTFYFIDGVTERGDLKGELLAFGMLLLPIDIPSTSTVLTAADENIPLTFAGGSDAGGRLSWIRE